MTRSNQHPQPSTKPVVSVVTAIDYAYQGDRSAGDIRATMAALAAQDFDGPVEFILTESADRVAQLPPDLTTILPSLQVMAFPVSGSYELMNAAVERASADIVAFVDGDCTPCPEWIRCLVETLHEQLDVVGVTGQTVYAGRTRWERMMALLSRSFVDPGGRGPTRFFSNNNGGMRRAVWLRHPLPTTAGPYASRLQIEAIQRDGGRFVFEPRMRLMHDYEGWRMERDIRRHHGYATVITRLLDRRMPQAWLIRLGYPAIPAIAAGKTLASWADCIRCAPRYGVRWHEVPLAMAVSVPLHLMEIPGMVQAYRGKPITDTAYR